MKNSITKKLTLLVSVVVLITAGVLGFSVNHEYDKLLTEQEIKIMGENTGKEVVKIETVIERMKEDTIFLSKTPPMQGIIRARANHGIDYVDGSTEKSWKKRLETIFESFLESKPHYIMARYIGIEEQGKEIVRVDRLNKKIRVYSDKEMQSKNNRSYFYKGKKLKANQTYVSDITYNREHGEITKPYVPVLRVVTPVYTLGGKLFGMVVLNLDVNFMFKDFLESAQEYSPGYAASKYITNQNGELLSNYDSFKPFSFEFDEVSNILTAHEQLKTFYDLTSEESYSNRVIYNGQDLALFARKAFLDSDKKQRFIVLFEEKQYKKVVEQANYVKKQSMLVGLFLLLIALLVTVLFSNIFTSPLKEIINSLSGFKKNKKLVKLEIKSKDEIGELASAFNEIVHNLDVAQEQLIQSEKMASIGQLAAGVAHEINNPVGFIGSNVNSLKKYTDDLIYVLDKYEAAVDYLKGDEKLWSDVEDAKNKVDIDFVKDDIGKLIKESSDGVKRVKDIVQDLKDFSHVDEAEWQWADLHEGLDSTLNIVNNEIKYKAEVRKIYGDLPNVECLASQLNQVFMNLLVNAAHSIEEHGVITIETGRTESDWIWISISDTGKGIPVSLQKKIFDPFFTTKPIGQGTGLGLSLSYGIVDKHGGHIDLESQEGKGTKFSIWLPVSQHQQVKSKQYG